MTLTPQQRLQAYEWAKGRVNSRRGVCSIFHEWYFMYNPFCYLRTKDVFPEFWAQRPEGAVFYWWPLSDTTSRLAALDRAIELVKAQL